VLSCAIGLVCYRVGALSGLCAIYFVCYRDVGYQVRALSGIVSIFRVLSGWCAIAPCANGTLPLTSQEHLWEILQKAWSEIPNSVLEKLVERMPRLVKKVLSTKGSWFDEKKCEF